MSRSVGLIGVPTSAAAFAPGQEQAPQALREAGLLELLQHGGVATNDHGECEMWRWRPDRGRPRAQNLPKVVEIVIETADRVRAAARDGEITLVLGGDCTVGIGTVAGQIDGDGRLGVLYFDSHADLNVPASVTEGALDWMGLAHMLGVEGAAPELLAATGQEPMLEADQVLLFGWGPDQATPFERDVIARNSIELVPVAEVAADPTGSARRALRSLEERCDRLLVHFDVDVIDFTDVPLSENWGRNEGLLFDDAMSALGVILSSPRLTGVTVTELNPDHAEQGGGGIERFVRALAGGLGASLGSEDTM